MIITSAAPSNTCDNMYAKVLLSCRIAGAMPLSATDDGWSAAAFMCSRSYRFATPQRRLDMIMEKASSWPMFLVTAFSRMKDTRFHVTLGRPLAGGCEGRGRRSRGPPSKARPSVSHASHLVLTLGLHQVMGFCWLIFVGRSLGWGPFARILVPLHQGGQRCDGQSSFRRANLQSLVLLAGFCNPQHQNSP